MSKFGLFVGVYSVVMMALFFTFCFLITNINPPQVKQDPEQTRRLENLMYSDEFLPNDNVGFGMEKVEDDYDDVFVNNLTRNEKNKPTIYLDKFYTTNCTRKDTVTMVTKSVKHVKGLRRSINKENQQDVPRTVHLKIKDLDGRPRIEIKVVPEKSKKIKTFWSSRNITNNTQTFYNDMTEYLYDNISKAVILVIENNEKLVLDFAGDSVSLYDDNNLDSEDDFIVNANKDSNLLNDKNVFKYNNNNGLLNTSIADNIFKKVMINGTRSNQTHIERTPIIKGGKSEVNSTEVLYSMNSIDTAIKKDFTNSTKDSNVTPKSHTLSDDRQTDETRPIIHNTLVGLLIPEATATLPFNYHFINK